MSASPGNTLDAPWQTLECLGVELAGFGSPTVHVKAPGQLFGLSFEQALRRIEEFKERDQGLILAMLPYTYSMHGYRVMQVTAGERHLVKNFRALDKSIRIAMDEVIDDLAEANRNDIYGAASTTGAST